MRAFVFLLGLIICQFNFSSLRANEQLTLEQKRDDIDQIVSLVKSSYGPYEYKKNALGIDVDVLRRKYMDLLEGTNNGDFYYLVLKMVAEFHDSHFSARIPADHASFLGFYTELVDGKVLIEEINRVLLPEYRFPFSRGDEVVAIGGRPVQEMIRNLSAFRGTGFEGTAERVGAWLLTYRRASIVPAPSGSVQVTLRRAASDTSETVELDWFEAGERLDETPSHEFFAALSEKPRRLRNFQLSIRDEMAEVTPNIERSYLCSGSTRIAIPNGAILLMMDPFVAYYHETEKGPVGYLRIPDYIPQDDRGEEAFDERFRQYEWAVTKLEENTVGLIIDQDHNCGGSVSYLEKMAGLFLREDYLPLQFQFLASKPEYLAFKEWFDSEPMHTLEREFFEETVALVKKHWLLGDFLTPKTSFLGNHVLKPNPRGYTKPIIMLIDEMSGSGGDAFPALLQGNGRVKLLGTRTMGAGGHVEAAPSLNNSGITLRMTKSLFYRPDGVAVENNGALPDIPYTITREDFMNGYRDYQRFYLEKLLEMIE